MSARDEIPCTVSCTNRRKQLQMSEQELNIQPEVLRFIWSRRKELMIKEWSPKGTVAQMLNAFS